MLLAHKQYGDSGGKTGEIIDLSGYTIENFSFNGLDLSSIDARVSVFKQCSFSECDLYGIHFNDSMLFDVDFRGANLRKSELHEANINQVCFDEANLSESEFIDAILCDTTFRSTDLVGCIITDCDLIVSEVITEQL